MQNNLKSVLLIDDHESTNYLNKMALEEAGFFEHLHIVTDGQKAIEYLTKSVEGKYPKPDLIFLDINMPVMDGWEFLEEYRNLQLNQKAKMVIIMLTTSMNPDDVERAKKYTEVSGYRNKPLSVEVVTEIAREYFLV